LLLQIDPSVPRLCIFLSVKRYLPSPELSSEASCAIKAAFFCATTLPPLLFDFVEKHSRAPVCFSSLPPLLVFGSVIRLPLIARDRVRFLALHDSFKNVQPPPPLRFLGDLSYRAINGLHPFRSLAFLEAADPAFDFFFLLFLAFGIRSCCSSALPRGFFFEKLLFPLIRSRASFLVRITCFPPLLLRFGFALFLRLS